MKKYEVKAYVVEEGRSHDPIAILILEAENKNEAVTKFYFDKFYNLLRQSNLCLRNNIGFRFEAKEVKENPFKKWLMNEFKTTSSERLAFYDQMERCWKASKENTKEFYKDLIKIVDGVIRRIDNYASPEHEFLDSLKNALVKACEDIKTL